MRKLFNTLIFAIAAGAIVYFVVHNFGTFVRILLVALGFGAVVIIHEFGHFVVAKLCGIKVEAFSIGFPPTLLGIQKTESGIRFRILPKLFAKETQAQGKDEGSLASKAVTKLTRKKKYKASETEYRIGLIPFGGFVKMLGQEDTGPAEETDDPRSFVNKPILVRIAVVAAGVIFNAISAVLIFMMVFLMGVNLPPAVIGNVRPNSPAEIAGLRPLDRIIEVNGERFVDFTSLPLAAAFSAKGQPISLLVEHPDKTREQFQIVAEESPGIHLRTIGISQADTLTVAELSNPKDIQQLYETTALQPGDVVTAFNGRVVEDSWQLRELIQNSLQPEGVLTIQRDRGQSSDKAVVDVKLPLYLSPTKDNFKKDYDLAHVYSLIPRMKILSVPDRTKPPSITERLISWWREKILRKPSADKTGPFLEVGDIIVKVGETENPTFRELREVTKEHKDNPMLITVLRPRENGSETQVTVTVFPRSGRGGDPDINDVRFGVVPVLDVRHAVVAGTIDIENGPGALEIPRGATITAVDGEEVSNFYDIMRIIRSNRGQRISMDYRIGADGGGVGLNIPASDDYITTEADFAPPAPGFLPTAYVPFEYLKEPYKAEGAVAAIKMGLKKTSMFIVQTYLTLQRLISREVSPKTLVGPVGIVTMSYKIVASRSLTYYVYFLGLISSILAVMNLLPLPIVDGGVIVLLIVEKIKGSPLNRQAQEIISYVGLVFILAFFLWLTYNDILNLMFR
jgi:regulator of sigma E protease